MITPNRTFILDKKGNYIFIVFLSKKNVLFETCTLINIFSYQFHIIHIITKGYYKIYLIKTTANQFCM